MLAEAVTNVVSNRGILAVGRKLLAESKHVMVLKKRMI